MELGISTRSDVIAILGPPTIDIEEYNAFVYAWLMNEYDLVVVSYGAGGLIDVYDSENRLFAFDKEDRLVAQGEVEWPLFGSIRDSTRGWLVESGSDPNPIAERFEPLEAADTEGVVYIFRSGPMPSMFHISALYPSAIAVDRQFRAELKPGQYFAFKTDPGVHHIAVHPIPPYRHRQASALEAPYTTPSINLNVEVGRSIYLRTESPTGLGSIDTFMVEEQELTALKMLEGMSSAW